MINLPGNIDYSKYYSDQGMATKKWGPAAWQFLFTCIMGHYPININIKNIEHLHLRERYRCMLESLQFIMPCIYCRNSFKQFFEELPIEEYLVGRIELMYWLYLMKNKVNDKLVHQENLCYNNEKKRLKSLFSAKMITEDEYYKKIEEYKNNESTFQTKNNVTFKEVLDQYEANRAICSDKSKSCVLPSNLI